MKTWRFRFAFLDEKKCARSKVTMDQTSINHLIRFSFIDWPFTGVMGFEPENCETSHIKKCVKRAAFKHAYYTTQFAQRDWDSWEPAPFKSSDMGLRKNKRTNNRTVITTLKTVQLPLMMV